MQNKIKQSKKNRKIAGNYFFFEYFIYTSDKKEYKKKRRNIMAVTEVGQQSVVMQRIVEAKRGGDSDEKIDRPEEARAILSFASNLTEAERKNLTQEENTSLASAIGEAISFMFFRRNQVENDSVAQTYMEIKKLLGNGIINENDLSIRKLTKWINQDTKTDSLTRKIAARNRKLNGAERSRQLTLRLRNQVGVLYKKMLKASLASCDSNSQNQSTDNNGKRLDIIY